MSELHQTTHWRRIREIIKALFKLERVSYDNYNLEKITCYKTIGDELQGTNTEFYTNDYRSCWVDDNHYDVYEIPKFGSEHKIEGEFYFLAHNTDFDYWLFGKMSYRVDRNKTKSRKILIDGAKFLPYGSYTIISNGKDFSIKKTRTGKQCDFGYRKPSGYFDAVGARKKAYRTSATKIVGSIIGIQQNMKNIKGGDTVRIYKKKPKKNTKRKF